MAIWQCLCLPRRIWKCQLIELHHYFPPTTISLLNSSVSSTFSLSLWLFQLKSYIQTIDFRKCSKRQWGFREWNSILKNSKVRKGALLFLINASEKVKRLFQWLLFRDKRAFLFLPSKHFQLQRIVSQMKKVSLLQHPLSFYIGRWRVILSVVKDEGELVVRHNLCIRKGQLQSEPFSMLSVCIQTLTRWHAIV